MMDCDTTGVEPDLALVKFKKLVGGGSMQIVNQTVPRALKNLGYQGEQVEAIVEFIAEHGHVVDAPGLRHGALRGIRLRDGRAVDRPDGPRADDGRGAARTCPAPSARPSTCPRVGDGRGHREIYFAGLEARPQGAGGLPGQLQGRPAAVRRAGSKPPKRPPAEAGRSPHEYRPVRKPPAEEPHRDGDQSFSVGGAEGYMTASKYPDDGLGELFLKLGKQGSTLAGVMDAFSIAISIGLQYGVPLETYVEKFTNMRFEPAGLTDDPDIRIASSVLDYIFRRLALDHLPFETRADLGILSASERAAQLAGEDPTALAEEQDPGEMAQSAPVQRPAERHEDQPEPGRPGLPGFQPHSSVEIIEAQQGRTADAPLCLTCGTKMRPAGSCYVCEGCGATSGCS